MTQDHLAIASGISVRTVRRAEKGAPVGPEAIRAICAVLGTDVAALAGDFRSSGSRAIPEIEFRIRSFVSIATRRIGGCHPLLLLSSILFVLWMTPATFFYAVSAPFGFYAYARKVGQSHGEALEFLRGRRLIDGSLVPNVERRPSGIV